MIQFENDRYYSREGDSRRWRCLYVAGTGRAVLMHWHEGEQRLSVIIGNTAHPWRLSEPQPGEFYPGMAVEVSQDGATWLPASYCGFVANYHVVWTMGQPHPGCFTHCRSVPSTVYREPTDADAQQRPQVEVRDREAESWAHRILLAVLPAECNALRYITLNAPRDGLVRWRQCRMPVTNK